MDQCDGMLSLVLNKIPLFYKEENKSKSITSVNNH